MKIIGINMGRIKWKGSTKLNIDLKKKVEYNNKHIKPKVFT